MKEVPVWTCQFEDGPADKLDNLTVGAKFGLKCRGDLPVQWSKGPLFIRFPKEEETHSLAVLEAPKLEPQDVGLVVTAYKAGAHKPGYIRVMQGEVGFEVAAPAWDVKSVLKQGQPTPPYPPFGPFGVALPLWILVAVLVAMALAVFLTVRKIRRTSQRRRMLEELKRHRTALSPLHQFYRDARGLRRRLHNVRSAEELKGISDDLNREFRLYVLRQFEVPALDWSDSEILKDLHKRHRKVFRHASDPLKKTLRELIRIKSQPQILLQDVEQLHRMSLDAAEKIEKARERAER